MNNNMIDYRKILILIIKNIGITEVRKILSEQYEDRNKFSRSFIQLLDAHYNRLYDYMEEADLIDRKFILPLFNKNSKGLDSYLDHVDIYLQGCIPDFDIIKTYHCMKIIKNDNRYDLKGAGIMGYNPLLNLEEYYDIFGEKIYVVAFNIKWHDGYDTP
uniref:Uncharacterized protein n=1 Tax=Pithovirus LCPAC302 TaxID=2506593 RepID=A0A481Z7A8_9VIRU|nr:MAG: hypothetical protein LCPAC302_00350 [Pithovirus LCPAC302]